LALIRRRSEAKEKPDSRFSPCQTRMEHRSRARRAGWNGYRGRTPMGGDCRRLSHEDVARALREVDPAELFTVESPDAGADQRWTVEPADELVLLRDPDGVAVASFAAADLRAFRCAVLTVLAARTLLVPTVITAAVLGSGPAARLLCS